METENEEEQRDHFQQGQDVTAANRRTRTSADDDDIH